MRPCPADAATNERFGYTVISLKCQLLDFLISAHREGKVIAGYGEPAEGNTLLSYYGMGSALLCFTVDRSPQEQGRYLPGSQLRIFATSHH